MNALHNLHLFAAVRIARVQWLSHGPHTDPCLFSVVHTAYTSVCCVCSARINPLCRERNSGCDCSVGTIIGVRQWGWMSHWYDSGWEPGPAGWSGRLLPWNRSHVDDRSLFVLSRLTKSNLNIRRSYSSEIDCWSLHFKLYTGDKWDGILCSNVYLMKVLINRNNTNPIGCE